MLSREVLVCLLFCPLFFSIIYLRGAVLHLFELGKSKSKIKKDREAMLFIEKMSLVGYVKRCEHHTLIAKRLSHIYCVYILVTFSCIFFLLLSTPFPVVGKVFPICVLARIIALDIPINIFGLIMTKHDTKNGGSTWIWREENR